MKFSKVVLSNPKGVEFVFRGTSQSVFQLESAGLWDLESCELGVLAKHPTREADLLVPWHQVATCDVLATEMPAKLKAAK